MRIAILTEGYFPEVSGVTLAVANHLEFLRGRGHELLLIHPEYPASMHQSQPRSTAAATVVTFDSQPLTRDRIEVRTPTVQAAVQVDRALREFRPDLVMYHNPDRLIPELSKVWKKPRVVGLAAAKSLGVPTVPVIHTLLPLYIARTGPWRWRNPLGAWLAQRVWAQLHNQSFDFAVTVDVAARAYLQRIGLRLPLLAGAYNGVDTRVFYPQQHDRKEGPLHICMVGRLAAEKNMQLLPALVAALGNAPFLLTVVGAGPLLSSLQQQLGGRPEVRFLGWRSSVEIAQVLSHADIYLSLSDTESYSLTASEALACGVPVVAPRALAFERLDGLGVGMLFPPSWLSTSGMRLLVGSLLELAPRVPAWSSAARLLAPSLSWELALGRLFTDLSVRLRLTI